MHACGPSTLHSREIMSAEHGLLTVSNGLQSYKTAESSKAHPEIESLGEFPYPLRREAIIYNRLPYGVDSSCIVVEGESLP